LTDIANFDFEKRFVMIESRVL